MGKKRRRLPARRALRGRSRGCRKRGQSQALMARFAAAALLLTLTWFAAAQAPPPAGATAPTLDTVLVTGEQPGPGLWKVTRRDSDHVLWILGTQAPLPKTISWRSNEVEKIIASSQEVLTDAQAELKVGFFRAVFLLPAALGAKKNADGKTLKDILPPDLYARWLPLKQRYLGRDDGVERL